MARLFRHKKASVCKGANDARAALLFGDIHNSGQPTLGQQCATHLSVFWTPLAPKKTTGLAVVFPYDFVANQTKSLAAVDAQFCIERAIAQHLVFALDSDQPHPAPTLGN